MSPKRTQYKNNRVDKIYTEQRAQGNPAKIYTEPRAQGNPVNYINKHYNTSFEAYVSKAASFLVASNV